MIAPTKIQRSIWAEAEAALAGSISETSSIWTPVIVRDMCSLTVSPALGRLGQKTVRTSRLTCGAKKVSDPFGLQCKTLSENKQNQIRENV